MAEMRLVSFLVNLTNARIGEIESVMSPVDGPTHRDPFGWPIIRGHYIKGADNALLCLKGYEVLKKIIFGEGGEQGISGSMIFNHHSLFALPIPSKDFGLLYATCPKALNELLLCLNNTKYNEFRGYLEDLVCALMNIGDDKILVYPQTNKQDIELFGGEIILKKICSDAIKPLYLLVRKLTIEPLGFGIKLGVVSDTMMNLIIRRGMMTKPGIKLRGLKNDVYEKVVENGPWFEEEIPKLSIFVGSLILRRPKIPQQYLRDIIDTLTEIAEEFSIKVMNQSVESSIDTLKKIVEKSSPIVISARETVGRGLFDIKTLECKNSNYKITSKNSSILVFSVNDIIQARKAIKELKEKAKGGRISIEINEYVLRKALRVFNDLKENFMREAVWGILRKSLKAKKVDLNKIPKDIREELNEAVNYVIKTKNFEEFSDRIRSVLTCLNIEDYDNLSKEIVLKTQEFLRDPIKVVSELTEEIHGKISAFPERIKRLGLLNIHYYYTEIKKESSGEGYPEMKQLVEAVIWKEPHLPEPSVEYLSKLISKYIFAEIEAMIIKRLVQSYKS